MDARSRKGRRMASQHSPKAAALTALILDIFRAHGRLLNTGDRLMKPLRQTSSRWQVLGSIETAPASVPQIGRKMGISRQSVQRTADILVEEGLCVFVPNPHHQKSPLLTLTKRGSALLAKISRVQVKWSNQLSADLKDKDIEAARRVLAGLLSH